MTLAPILLFVYNRPDHTARTLAGIKQNHEANLSDLYVFSDGPRRTEDVARVQEVRDLLTSIVGFKSVNISISPINLGLANSIIRGVTEVLNKHQQAIVLEDDILVSKHFLNFMNQALTKYANDPHVASIHGWNFPLKDKALPDTFFLRGADCWGWATWKRAWNGFEPDGSKLLMQLESQNLSGQFDLDGAYPYTQMLKDQITGKNNSWAIRWHASMFLQDKVTLHPGKSLVQNIGLDGSGVHTGEAKAYETQLSQKRELQFPPEVTENDLMRRKIITYLKNSEKPRFISRLKSKFNRWLSLLNNLIDRF